MSDILEKINDTELIASIRDYVLLASFRSFTESDADSCYEILKMAESDRTLNFLIDEVEHILGHESDLIDTTEILDLQALLRERIGTQIPECINRSVGANTCSTSSRETISCP